MFLLTGKTHDGYIHKEKLVSLDSVHQKLCQYEDVQ